MREKEIRAAGPYSPPTVSQLEEELNRELCRRERGRILCSIICTLITTAAAAVLVITLCFPVLRIYGTSMAPTVTDGDIVVSVKGSRCERGDMIAFRMDNRILVKRVIGQSGEWVDIDENGTVWINGEPLEEGYLTEKALGECDIELPCQVPDDQMFVMGDHRFTSSDSRSSEIGCVTKEQIVGKLIVRVWPFSKFGLIK